MEQAHHLRRIRVNGAEVRPFAKVTALTSPGEIRRIVRAGVLPRDDVVEVERPEGKVFLVEPTVFVTPTGAVADSRRVRGDITRRNVQPDSGGPSLQEGHAFTFSRMPGTHGAVATRASSKPSWSTVSYLWRGMVISLRATGSLTGQFKQGLFAVAPPPRFEI